MSESGAVWWWEQDSQFRFTSFTESRDETLSARNAVSLGLRRWELPDAEPCRGTWDEHRRVHEARQPFHNFEYRVGALYVSVTGLPTFSADGEFLGYRGTAHDVTALKAAQAAAHEKERLLRLASRLGRVGAWAVDEPSMRGSWSSELLDIYELPPGTALTTELLFELVEPGCRESVRDALRRCHRDGETTDVEFPSRTAKGRAVWLRLSAEALRDASGAIRRVQGVVQDITERRQDAERLRQLSTDLTATFESITDALLTVDAGLRCTYANGQAARLTHRSRQELVGCSLPELFPSLCGTAFLDEMERVRQSRCTGHLQTYHDTAQAWLNVTLYPSAQGVTLIVRDVTESHLAQQALAMSEERFRLLFETSADGILKVGLDFRIRAANRAACRMFGRTLEDLRELRSVDLASPSDARLQDMIRERLRAGGASGELTLVRADGSTFEADVDTSTYTNSAGETFYNIVVRDVTERVRLRRKLHALNEELARRVRERTRELERANSELKGFARSLAHDLRQPIAAAKAFSNALLDALDKGNTDAAQRHARQVTDAASTMGAYVEALLSLAHISQVSLEIEEVDLSAMANALLDQLQGQAPSRKLIREIEPELYAEGDATLLRMLLQNLVGNAWKFTSKTDVARISLVKEVAADGSAVYCVRDNGAGFDMAHAGKLFGTFQRLHTQSEFAGTGIGLANAQRIVSRHGGRIWAESGPGKGATFRFTLGHPTGPQSRLLPLMPS
jgi:PAS domain S-box-containing protein